MVGWKAFTNATEMFQDLGWEGAARDIVVGHVGIYGELVTPASSVPLTIVLQVVLSELAFKFSFLSRFLATLRLTNATSDGIACYKDVKVVPSSLRPCHDELFSQYAYLVHVTLQSCG